MSAALIRRLWLAHHVQGAATGLVRRRHVEPGRGMIAEIEGGVRCGLLDLDWPG